MKLSTLAFSSTFILSSLVFSSQENRDSKLNCTFNGGGYIEQHLQITRVGDDSIEFELERFSPVPEIVPNIGIKVKNELAKRFKVKFPAKSCLTRQTAIPQIQLIYCHTGISKTDAELVMLDGTQKTARLDDNSVIEISRTTTESVLETQTKQILNVKLDLRQEEANNLGFLVRNCK